MSESKAAEGQMCQTETESIDVRAELKKNLSEEFATALSQQAALTDNQRRILAALVNDESASPTSILQALANPEDKQ